MKYCTYCGNEIKNEDKFCKACGSSVIENNIPQNKTKKCIHCKQEIDKKATTCPICRKSQTSGCASVLIVTVLILFLCAIIATYKSDYLQEKQKKENIPKNIGEELICSSYKVTINEYKIVTGDLNDFQKVPDGTEWIGLIVTATNTSDHEVGIDSSNFKLTNSNGEIISNDFISYAVFGDYSTLGGTLAPNGTKTGYVSFTNPNTDNSNLSVKFQCGTWQTGSYIIPLK